MQPIITIARNTFVESLRQPVLFIIVILSGVLQLLNTWGTGFSMGFSKVPGEITGDNKLLFDVGLATVFVCGILLASFIATAAISREIENKTVLTIVSKPIGRHAVVVGKFLGVALAMMIAVVIMLVFLLLAIRHGVMSTAADDLDRPVLLFGLGAVLIAFFVGAVTNYLYGWAFGQTTVTVLLPAVLVAYLLVLTISPGWEIQPLGTDFKPQVTIACFAIGMALLVITAVATAASTRLGQVMTIVVCAGVFLLGLLSNHLVGRHAFVNKPFGVVQSAVTDDGEDLVDFFSRRLSDIAAERTGLPASAFEDLSELRRHVDVWDALSLADRDDENLRELLFESPGSTYVVELVQPATVELRAGDPFYYGPAPNGLGMAVPGFRAPGPETRVGATRWGEETAPAVVISGVDDKTLTVRNIGPRALDVARPPITGDFVFLGPTRMNWFAVGLWSVIPNMHFFWLVDAITKNEIVPASHVGLIGLYGLVQILASLSVAVMLFQTRDVG